MDNTNLNFDYDFEIVADYAAKRTDQFLSEKTLRSRTFYSNLIEKGKITVNGKIPKKSDQLKVGDVINVIIPKEEIPDITPKKMDFEIILDTPRYAVINKPAGITVHPSPGHYDDSLVNGLMYAFNIKDDTERFRPGIVHRLDKDTSGLLIIAKDRDAREKLSKMFAERSIQKYYIAVAAGHAKFQTVTIEEPIDRDKNNRQRMCVSNDGRYAKTEVNLIEQYKRAFIVNIKLYTGRTHQIRVHMKHIGHPLVGDEVYGKLMLDLKTRAPLIERQALHAYKLVFTDPFDGELIDITAPMPEDMMILLGKLK